MRNIIYYPHETLRKRAEPVDAISADIRALVNDMVEIMYNAGGVGIAAPQVDVSLRLFVVQKEGECQTFINPSLQETSRDTIVMQEGCLSLPSCYANVKRSQSLSIRAQDIDGTPFVLDAEGMLARVILHEMDHLNGVLFIDHLDEHTQKQLLAVYSKKRP